MANEIIISSDSRPYKSLITDIGTAKMANAALEGRKVNIVEMHLGDGGGTYYMPTTDATALVNEVWTGEIASKTINEASPNIIAVKTVVPSNVGGFTVREAGLFDDEGDLIAVCNMPDIGKATLPEGISSSIDIVMNILLTNVDAVNFVINPTLDPASREDVAEAVAAHNESPTAHPNLAGAAVAAHNESATAHPTMGAHIRSMEVTLNGSETLTGEADPTVETVGKVGQHYINTKTGNEWECTEIAEGKYTWTPVDPSSESFKSMQDMLKEASDTAAQAKKVADGAAEAIAAVQNTISVIPSQSGSPAYTGSAQTPTWNNFSAEMMTLTYGSTTNPETRTPAADFTGEIAAGTYKAYFTPKGNYTWSDKTKTEKEVTWTIQKATIPAVPSQSGSLTYTGSAQTPTWSNFNATQMTKVEEAKTDAGEYQTTFTPTANFKWTDGSSDAKTAPWSIGRATIEAVPVQSGSPAYTGSAQTPTWTGYDSAKLTISGDTSGTNAGTYNVTFTPTSNYQWADGTTTAKPATWTIAKAAGSLTLDKSTMALNNTTTFSTITVTRPGDGAISAQSSNPGVATVSVSENTVLVTSVKDGNATVTVSVAEGTNHTAPEDKTCAVTVSIPHVYGAQWDGTSTTKWSRTDASALFTDPVPAVNNGNGSSPFDNLQPWAGMTRVSDNAAGELVRIPKFWYKWTKSGNTLKLQIADKATDGFRVSPAHMDRGDGKGERDVVYVGRYHCASNYKSVTGQAQQHSITRSAARSGIKALGTGIWQWDMAMRVTIQMLYLVEYADWDSQKTIGFGCSAASNKENNGKTDGMTYHTGTTAANRQTYGYTQYRNIEGLWDNVYDWLDGCYYNSNGLNIIKNPANFSDTSNGTAVGVPSNGYPSAMTVATQAGLEWVIYPTAANGSDTTYVPDNWYFSASYPCLYVGGYYGQGRDRGLFYVYYGAASSTGTYIGCRLQKLP